MLGGCNSKFVIETVVPNSLHIVPVLNDSMLNWIAQLQNTLLGLRFLPDIELFVAHSHNPILVFWSPDNGGKRCFGCIVSRNACLTHARPIVNDHGSIDALAHRYYK